MRLPVKPDNEEGESKEKEKEKAKVEGAGHPKVLADGTYATETVFTNAAAARLEYVKTAAKPPLRSRFSLHADFEYSLVNNVGLALILKGDFYAGSVLSSTLTKLVLRFADLSTDAAASKTLKVEAMLIMGSVIRFGQSKFVTIQIDEDSNERIMNCIQTPSELHVDDSKVLVREVFLDDTKYAFENMLGAQEVCSPLPQVT